MSEHKEDKRIARGSSDRYSWTYTREEVWVLGFIIENHVHDIQATAKRNKNGSWSWRIPISGEFGIEPSRKEVFKKVYDVLYLEAV